MLITKVQIKLSDEKDKRTYGGNCEAIVSIVFDCNFIIKNIRLMKGLKGEYLVFPTTKTGMSIAYPIKEEYRQYILNEVLKEMEGITNE